MSIVARSIHYPVVDGFEPSRTKQSPLEETKIHRILERFQATGVLPNNGRHPLTEFFETSDFQEVMNARTKMEVAYESLNPDAKNRIGSFEDFAQVVFGEKQVEGLVENSQPVDNPVDNQQVVENVKPAEKVSQNVENQ